MDALTFGRLRGFDRIDQALLVLSIASSVAYMATRGLHPFQGSVVLKALGMAPLAVLAFRVLGRVGSRDRALLTSALALSCAGDVFLALGFRRYFVHGLAAFLLAHVAYIVLFTRNWARPLRPSAGQMVLVALVLAYFALACAWLWPGVGGLKIPALAYAMAVTAMTVAAILAGFSRPFVWIGALLFLFSDSLIATGFFKMPLSRAAALIWPTYYLGQYGIAIGLLRERAADDRTPAR
ncbi:MAG: lysoplasmalogenase [Candidatus Rokuibacteriota bacterium]